jgi:hypothetical protein
MPHDVRCFIVSLWYRAASHVGVPRPSASVRTEPVPAAVDGTGHREAARRPARLSLSAKAEPPTALVRRVSALIDRLRGLLLCFRSDGALGQTLPVMQPGAFDLVARAVHSTTGIPRVAR